MITNTKKNTIKLNRHTGKEIGMEVRKSHFLIGTDNPYLKTQYRNDYNPYLLNNNRKHVGSNSPDPSTNIKLGEYNVNYSTSHMLQNKDIEKLKPNQQKLDEKIKNELINSHFKLGSYPNNYQTVFQSDFEPKIPNNTNNTVSSKDIEKSLRSHSYVLGNHPVDYKSENKFRFSSPDVLDKVKKNKINIHELMKSNYKFGNDDRNWVTSTQAFYQPHNSAGFKPDYNPLKRSYVSLGSDNIEYASTNKNSMILPKTDENPKPPILSKELRKQYYKIGNGYIGDQEKGSLAKKDMVDPKSIKTHIVNKKVDTFLAMASHFSIGEKPENPKKHYESIYKDHMAFKTTDDPVQNQKNKHPLCVKIAGNDHNDFISEKQLRYNSKKNEITRKEIDDYKNNVIGYYKGQHWNLGTETAPFESSSAVSLNYDRSKARFANLSLGDVKKKDLKSVHYNLGYSQVPFSTTHLSSYKPLENIRKTFMDPAAKKTHLDFNTINTNFETKTIYKTDFVPKEIED